MNVLKNGINSYKEQFVLLLACVIFILLSCWKQNEKADFNMDEIATYVYANNTGNKQWDWQQKLDNPRESLEVFFTVNEYNPPFNYTNAWENAIRDTHPPVYYMLVHTVASLFYGEFSKYIPFVINAIFGCLIIILLYKLVKVLFMGRLEAVFCALVFAVNPALIDMTTFLRMYVMGMFCCLLLAYLTVQYWGRWNRSFYFFNTLILVFGCLTHYYFLVYAFFVYGMIALYHFLFKEWKRIGYLILSGIVGAGIVLAIFPAIIDHMFGAGDGPRCFDALFQWRDWIIRLQQYYSILNRGVFHGITALLLIAAMAGFVLAYREREKQFLWRVSAIGIPTICYFLIVSKVTPYIQERYLCLIYPMVMIWIFSGILQLINMTVKVGTVGFRTYLCGIIFLIMEISAYPQYTWGYTLKEYNEQMQPQLDKVTQYDCLVVSDVEWTILTCYQQLSQYKTITYLKTNQELEMAPGDYTGECLIVYLTWANDETYLNKILDKFIQYDSYELIIDDSPFYNVYRLYQAKE